MIKLSIEQVLSMHKMLLEQTGGDPGVRDLGLLDSALSSAFQTFGGNDVYPSLEEKSAHLAYSIVNNHPFVDGNKRIGLFVMLVFLELNQVNLEFTQEELVELGLGLANGAIDSETVLSWIKSHIC